MLHALPLALLAAISAAAAAPQEPAQPTIVVTGQRLQDYRDALARCLARRCPTNEDADASLALAEALFLNGDYHQGRDVLQAALRRNRRNARAFPEPVSDLYRGHARLSRHLGMDNDARRSTYGILSALRQGIPEEDHRHFTARFEISEMQMEVGDMVMARRELTRLADAARAAGREDVATIAELRMLWLALRDDTHGPARQELLRLTRLTAPADRIRATGAKLLLSRLLRLEGHAARADALLAEIASAPSSGSRRRLLNASEYQLAVQQVIQPVYEVPEGRNPFSTFANGLRRLSDNFEDKWIDVGFWILPNGRVSGLEILRESNDPDWANPLIASIRDRLYSAGTDATYRMERYTYTAGYERRTG
ncbi:MAG TPA: hypothetical protein VJS15_00925, partial [Allosphingosinicella sp.]|nr:hypothetical protein [Allosphingosinicella sp.]